MSDMHQKKISRNSRSAGKRSLSTFLVFLLLLGLAASAMAEPVRNAVTELYSADGSYQDEIGNYFWYSYHVPQIDPEAVSECVLTTENDDHTEQTAVDAAEEINAEIRERFGEAVEEQFSNMREELSLWMLDISWKAYWNGDRLYLLVSEETDWGFTDYAVYGFDFVAGQRVTNEMVLAQAGVEESVYRENLREKTQLIYEDLYRSLPEEQRENAGYYEQLERTVSDENLDEAVLFLDGTGEIEAVMKIYSLAGADWYYHLVTPFAYG